MHIYTLTWAGGSSVSPRPLAPRSRPPTPGNDNPGAPGARRPRPPEPPATCWTFGARLTTLNTNAAPEGAGIRVQPRKQPTPLYAYCIVRLDAEEPWEVFLGIGRRPVFAVRDQKMAVLVSRVESSHLENARSIVQHGQVIHRVFERYTVLPFRYGTVFATEEQVGRLLRENRDQFTETIRLLRGKAEMHVKLQFHPAAQPLAAAAAAAGQGADPVAAAGDSGEEPARRLAQRITEIVHPLQEQVSVRVGRDGQVFLDLCHLVEDEQVQSYQKLSALAAARLKDCQVQVTGPWAPFHFLPLAVRIPARSERLVTRSPERAAFRSR